MQKRKRDMTKILIDEAVVRQAIKGLERSESALHKAKAELNQALANAALDKMADNARELGLDYMEGSAEQYEKELEQPAPAQEPDPDELTIAYMSGLHEGKKRKPFIWLTNAEIAELKILPGANRERTATEMAFAVRDKLMEKNQ
jgi:hypothetical protein